MSVIRIAVCQAEVIPGNIKANLETVLKFIDEARVSACNVFVFPELMLTGYLIGDTWEEESFLNDAEKAIEDIKDFLDMGEYVIIGNVRKKDDELHTDGRKVLHNSAFVVNKSSTMTIDKILLPNYREFDEPRHFTPGSELQSNIFFINDVAVKILICEDGWDANYPIKPIDITHNSSDVVINISCSPFTLDKNSARDRVFGAHAKKQNAPLIYCNSIGIQDNGKTVYTFDGSSCVYSNKGVKLGQVKPFDESIIILDVANIKSLSIKHNSTSEVVLPYPEILINESLSNRYTRASGIVNLGRVIGAVKETYVSNPSYIKQLKESVIYGIQKYLERIGNPSVVIGASGGLDSCVVAALVKEAQDRLGGLTERPKLVLVNMPSRHNSGTTKEIASKLARMLDANYIIHSIEDMVNSLVDNFPKDCGCELKGIDIENIQARMRSTTVLAMYASAYNGVYTCNGNKTELAVGYATMGGDLTGFLAPIADLWKHQVVELAHELNKEKIVIPLEVFNIIPSAELSEDQDVDQGKGDPLIYWYHDRLFRAWVEKWNRWGPTETLQSYQAGTLNTDLGIPEGKSVYELFSVTSDFIKDMERWWNLFVGMSVVKRVQAPPVLAVSRRAFGFDYRESLNAKHGYTQKYYRLKSELQNVAL